jgi:8-oxo-dGTP pyrophosphatase MutT (NUDIX family)
MIPTISLFTRRSGINVHRLSSKLHFLFFTLIALLVSAVIFKPSINDENEGGDDVDHSKVCPISFGSYQGVIYSKSDSTQQNTCLVESPWMRISQHTVATTTTSSSSTEINEDEIPTTTKTIHDWLFIDYHDRINVLVESPPHPASDKEEEHETDEKQYIILEQTKYALEQTSLAIVGGLIEPSDEGGAIDAAKREVLEELSISCYKWKDLGKFRTDVNRGMGWVRPFLATDCTYETSGIITSNLVSENGDRSNHEIVGAHDTEKQHVRKMSLKEVRRAVMDGKFVEVQWSNTVALAVLYLSAVE